MLTVDRAHETLGDRLGGLSQMIEIECPWCTQDQHLDLVVAVDAAELECDACGTTVSIVDETEDSLPLAA